MGHIKDLQEKVEAGTATDAEKAELEELKKEASEVTTKTTTTEVEKEESEDEAIERMADALVSKVSTKLDSVTDAIKKADEKTATPSATKQQFIVDKSLGQVTAKDLEGIEVELPGRKAAGKQVTSVSARTFHFVSAMANNDHQKLQVLSEGTAAAGGYLVPEEFANMIVEDIRDQTVMRQLADVFNVSGDTFHLPRLDTRPQAQWRSEGAVKATSTAQFSEIVLTPYSLASIVPMTQELEADASLGVGGSIVNYIASLMTQALAEKEDKAFWSGSGTGQPTGVNTYSISSRAKGSNFADTVINIYHDLPQGYRNRAVWVASKWVLAQVRQLKDSQNRYLVQNLGDTPFGELLGRPMYEQNDLAQSELYFGDFSYYKIADRQGIQVDVSREATVGSQNAFERNLTFVRVEKRVDGELSSTQAVRKITGI